MLLTNFKLKTFSLTSFTSFVTQITFGTQKLAVEAAPPSLLIVIEMESNQ